MALQAVQVEVPLTHFRSVLVTLEATHLLKVMLVEQRCSLRVAVEVQLLWAGMRHGMGQLVMVEMAEQVLALLHLGEQQHQRDKM
jgi:hypothetical protein